MAWQANPNQSMPRFDNLQTGSLNYELRKKLKQVQECESEILANSEKLISNNTGVRKNGPLFL
jgi:hypothetical protein